MSCTTWLVAFSTAIVTFTSPAAVDISIPQYFDGLQLSQNTSNEATAATESSGHIELYGPVRKNENLWQISKRYHTSGTTMSQTMMGIYEENRSAFVGNNINRLRTRVKLKIPSVRQISTIDHKQAYTEVLEYIAEYEVYVKKINSPEPNTTLSSVETVNVVVTNESQIDKIEQTNLELIDIELIKKELKLEQAQIEQNSAALVAATTIKKEKAKKKRVQKSARPLFRYSYDVSIAHDDNIRKAQNEIDIRTDNTLSLTLNAKAGTSLSRFTLLSYGGSIQAEKFSEFDELDNLSFNVNVKYRFAFASGFASPIYFLGLKVGGIESAKIARDSTTYSINFGVNKWLTDTINMSLGIDHRQRNSRSRVFDTVENQLFGNLDINLSKTTLLYSTYTYIIGDIVSSATPTLAIINASEVIEPDDAFGGIATNQFAYRLDSVTQVITLGYNKIVFGKTSIDLSYRFVKTESEGNIEYDRSIFRASLLGRF